MLQAWALPIENNIGVGGFDLAPAANPLTSGVGREGSLGCSASSVPPERLRLSPIEGVSKIKVIEEGDFWSCRRVRQDTVLTMLGCKRFKSKKKKEKITLLLKAA